MTLADRVVDASGGLLDKQFFGGISMLAVRRETPDFFKENEPPPGNPEGGSETGDPFASLQSQRP